MSGRGGGVCVFGVGGWVGGGGGGGGGGGVGGGGMGGWEGGGVKRLNGIQGSIRPGFFTTKFLDQMSAISRICSYEPG
jgi:hypothetical protein